MSDNYRKQLSGYLYHKFTKQKLYKEVDHELMNVNLFSHMKYHDYYGSYLSFICPILASAGFSIAMAKNNKKVSFHWKPPIKKYEILKNLNKISRNQNIMSFIMVINIANFLAKINV